MRVDVRLVLALLVLVAGVALALVSYFILASPLGLPVNEGSSNPRMPFAATVFVFGVVLVFLSAVVYELFPERRGD